MSSNFFWSMFYGGDNPQNEIDNLIKEDRLEDILGLNSLMQEINSSPKLIEYLSKPSTIQRLIQYAYEPSVDKARRQLSQIANDIFVYDISALLDNISDSEDLLDTVFSALRPYDEKERRYATTEQTLAIYRAQGIDIESRPSPFDTLPVYDFSSNNISNMAGSSGNSANSSLDSGVTGDKDFDFDKANSEVLEDDGSKCRPFVGPILRALRIYKARGSASAEVSSSDKFGSFDDMPEEGISLKNGNIDDNENTGTGFRNSDNSAGMNENENENSNGNSSASQDILNSRCGKTVTLMTSSATTPLPFKELIARETGQSSKTVFDVSDHNGLKGNIFRSDAPVKCDDPMRPDTSPGAELCVPQQQPVNPTIAAKIPQPVVDQGFYYYEGIKVQPTCTQRRVPLAVTENFCRLIIMLIRNPVRISKLQGFLLKHPEVALLFCETIQAAPITEAFHYLVVGKPESSQEFYEFQTAFLSRSNTIENMLALYINNANFDSLMHVSFILCSLLSSGTSQFTIRQKLLQDLPLVINLCMNERIHPGSARTLLQITVSVFRETIKCSILETDRKKSLFYARAIENLLIPCVKGLDKMLSIDFKNDGVYGLLKLHAISGLAELLRLSDLAKDACQDKWQPSAGTGMHGVGGYGNSKYEFSDAVNSLLAYYSSRGCKKYQFTTLADKMATLSSHDIMNQSAVDAAMGIGSQLSTSLSLDPNPETDLTTTVEDDENYERLASSSAKVQQQMQHQLNNNRNSSSCTNNNSNITSGSSSNSNITINGVTDPSQLSLCMMNTSTNPEYNALVNSISAKPVIRMTANELQKQTMSQGQDQSQTGEQQLLPFVIGISNMDIVKQMYKAAGGPLYCGDEERTKMNDAKDRPDTIKIRDTLGFNGEIIYGSAAYIAKYLVDRDLPFKAMCQMLLYPNHSIIHHAVSVITTQLLEYTSYCPELSMAVFNPLFFELLRITIEEQNNQCSNKSLYIRPEDSEEVRTSKVKLRLQTQTLRTSLDAYATFLIDALNKAACGVKSTQKNIPSFEGWADLKNIIKNDQNFMYLTNIFGKQSEYLQGKA